MSTIQPPSKAPYEDLLNKLIIFVAVGLYLRFVGLTRTVHEIQRFTNHINSFEQRRDPSFATSSSPSSPKDEKQNPKPPILKASSHHNDKKHHLLLTATGSVATIKIPLILSALSSHPNLSIRLILSPSARQFLQGQSAEQPTLASIAAATPNLDGIHFDSDEWSKPWVRGDNILHIELRRWADLMVVAPLSANALAKITQGTSSDLITSVIRAWDASGLVDPSRPGIPFPYPNGKSPKELESLPEGFRSGRQKGIMVAPSMNTAMWSHPVTAKQIAILEDEWGVGNGKGGWIEVLRPMEKTMACGDTGSGPMKDWREIVEVVEERLGLGREREGEAKPNDED